MVDQVALVQRPIVASRATVYGRKKKISRSPKMPFSAHVVSALNLALESARSAKNSAGTMCLSLDKPVEKRNLYLESKGMFMNGICGSVAMNIH